SGKWKDPFSSADHTARQRAYNRALRGTGGAYTPQMVIDGAAETVGSRQSEVDRLIARRESADAAGTVTIVEDAGTLAIRVEAKPGATIRLVRFARAIVTRVAGGENAGKSLAEAHVVRRAEALGVVGGSPFTATARASVAGEGCAVLVEDGDGGRVLAAQYCP
ncbi:MAG: DUF1223 domain-containing protein, partial [Parvularculaceae bacterium]